MQVNQNTDILVMIAVGYDYFGIAKMKMRAEREGWFACHLFKQKYQDHERLPHGLLRPARSC